MADCCIGSSVREQGQRRHQSKCFSTEECCMITILCGSITKRHGTSAEFGLRTKMQRVHMQESQNCEKYTTARITLCAVQQE